MTAFILLALAASSAQAQQPAPGAAAHVDIRWDERGGSVLRTQVAPGKFTEWCSPLKDGEIVTWEFESAETVDFNIHWHQQGNIHYPVQNESVSTWSGRLVAASDQTYCWMWANRTGTPVALRALVQKAPRAVGGPGT